MMKKSMAAVVAVMALAAKNLMRSETGRAFMAVRDMDVAASVIGIPMMRTKSRIRWAFALPSYLRVDAIMADAINSKTA